MFDWLINLPAGFLAITFLLFALSLVLVLSARQNNGSLFAMAFTPSNFTQILSDPFFGKLVLRSLLIAGAASLATVLLAYPVAYHIAFRAGSKQNLWMILITLPFWTSYLLRIFAWKIILGYNGILNSGLVALRVPGAPFLWLLYNPGAVVVTLAHAYAAFAILPIFVSLSAIDKKLLEAGGDLGANPFTVFRRVVLPLSMPGVAAALLLVFIPTLGDYATPILVGGPSSMMIGNLIELNFTEADNWPLGSAMAVALVAVLLLCYLAWRGARSLRRSTAV